MFFFDSPLSLQLQYPVQADNQPLPTECGHVNRIGVGFTITNARDIAQKGELPWMVALLDSRSRLPLGGGSLITRDVVLTSSTKTLEVPEKYLIVRAGEWDFESITEERAHEDVAIRKIVRHTKWIKQLAKSKQKEKYKLGIANQPASQVAYIVAQVWSWPTANWPIFPSWPSLPSRYGSWLGVWYWSPFGIRLVLASAW